MADAFNFAIRKADMRRLDALRLALDSDFWPEAAFAIFRSARVSGVGIRTPLPPAAVVGARLAASARGFHHVFPLAVRVRQYRPEAEILDYLSVVSRLHGLPRPAMAATALVSAWAADPAAWSQAPVLAVAA